MQLFQASLYFIEIFTRIQQVTSSNLNKNIVLFYAKYFSRLNISSTDFLCVISCINSNQKRRTKMLFCSEFKIIPAYLRKNFIYLKFLLKNFYIILAALKDNRLFENVKKTKRSVFTDEIICRKIYSIKNLSIPKHRNFRLPANKFKKNYKKFFDTTRMFSNQKYVINLPVLLTKLNIVLNMYKLKGFTKNALEILINILDAECKNLLLKIGKLAKQRNKYTYSKIEQWGRKNTSFSLKKHVSFFDNINQITKKEKILRKYVSFFRKNRKSVTFNKYKNIPIFKVVEKKTNEYQNKTKVDIYLENLKKTNKTLMALLNGILQRRICILKEATKCLHSYKPSPPKIVYEKINSIVPKETKINYDLVKQNNYKIISKQDIWCTGKDCLKFLDIESSPCDRFYYFKWFLYVCNDYNSQYNFDRSVDE